jgi:hypothetical protein
MENNAQSKHDHISEEQYGDLIKFLNEFSQSEAFKQMKLSDKRSLKKIIVERSHISGWRKFITFIEKEANATTVITFSAIYGQTLTDWIRIFVEAL